MNTKLFLVSLVSLAFGLSAHAQLSVTAQGPTIFASTVQASIVDQATLDTVGSISPPSFVLGGLTFNAIANPSSYALGEGFFADISYVGQSKIDVNNLFVENQNTAVVTGLYTPYSAASVSDGFRLTGEDSFSLVHQDTSFAGGPLIWQSDVSHFKFYEAVDFVNNLLIDLVLIDDRGSQFVDFNDGRFLVEQNLNPVGIPVPEPSTYGLIGAGALLALAIGRRFRK